ncbi:MAG: DUF4965 domain-containing protein [Clostridia bacterium]|nr:DUF4965 domain-containing protein [Clostridia bacterium]
MKLRPPAVPLITVDPYFSIWSPADELYSEETVHWTGAENIIEGIVTVDGEDFRFMGNNRKYPVITQAAMDVTALVTEYDFVNEKITLNVKFYTPLFTDDLYRLSRPVSYMKVKFENVDGVAHKVSVKLSVSEQICLDKAGDDEVTIETVQIKDGINAVKMGSKKQEILGKFGDDLRIDWGYFYLCPPADSSISSFKDEENMNFVSAEFACEASKVYDILFAYDDIYSLEYFKKHIKAYWHTKGLTIEEAMKEALEESEEMLIKCNKVSYDIYKQGKRSSGIKYAEIISLAYRQILAAHKLAVTDEGELVYISKECFSNGCAATVDVTYPSSPFFLLYNTELLKGMLVPIFKYDESDEWVFDFAPHDVGTYPVVNGQRYGWKSKTLEEYKTKQMPVEECGNMLILMANIAMVDKNTDFADRYMAQLDRWVKYLIKYGEDPENQLCTDDFAGHMAHNCNLSLKAIMGIAGYSIILKMQGKAEDADKYMKIAKDMADSWVKRAANKDGSFRLAFDKPGTFSMKYNIVWDKFWHTNLFSPYVLSSEYLNNCKHINYYGMPLDSRKAYTKSDWLVWTACLAPSDDEFEKFITPLWDAYNVSNSRVPMTDWYDTNTSIMIGFKHRTVQGGLYIKFLEDIL